MTYFKYWVKETFKISIEGAYENITILSASNISKKDAFEEEKLVLTQLSSVLKIMKVRMIISFQFESM